MVSASSHFAASPTSSNVTSLAAHGICSPAEVSNTRQSGRKSIMGCSELFDFLNKIGCLVEPPVDAGVTDVSHRVDSAQALHHLCAHGAVRHLAVELVREVVHDALDQRGDGFLRNGTLLAGLFDAGHQLVAGEFLRPPIALEDQEAGALDDFVSRVTIAATNALAATADSRPFPGRARIDDLVILTTALRATHKARPSSIHCKLWPRHCYHARYRGVKGFVGKNTTLWRTQTLR